MTKICNVRVVPKGDPRQLHELNTLLPAMRVNHKIPVMSSKRFCAGFLGSGSSSFLIVVFIPLVDPCSNCPARVAPVAVRPISAYKPTNENCRYTTNRHTMHGETFKVLDEKSPGL
jgi:hypothetical protein